MMLVARHFRRRLLMLSVSTLGFFISSFSVVLATDLDGDTIEVLHNHHPGRIRLRGSDSPEKSVHWTRKPVDNNQTALIY